MTHSKTAWAGLKSILKLKDKSSECSVNVNNLNSFFARFECDSDVPTLPVIDDSLELFSFDSVYNVFKHVNVGKASGPDKISARLIRTLADCLAEPMCTLYNNSIKQGKVPKIWKSAHITPLPKVKGANQPKDFRPIALTPILAKCFERLVSPYIKDKIDDTNQYAYRRNRSTDDALLVLLDRITYELDKSPKNYVRPVFIDFISAFNTINSSILIQRLTDKQINSNIVAWVYDFLTDRSQRVKTCNEISEALTVSTGCPQGCVLSPILFSLYVECMTVSGSNMHMVKYADDTVIIELCSPDQATNLQAERSHIAAWCEDNSLPGVKTTPY